MPSAALPRIVVVGSANVDLVAGCRRLPRPGETVGGAELARLPGGKGANQALAAARLGARVSFIGRVGRDDLPLRPLAREGVDISGVARDDGETGVALIAVDERGETMIVVAPEANGRLRPQDIEIEEHDAVIAQLEIPLAAVARAGEQARFFCLNAAPANGPLALRRAPDLLVVNRHEHKALGPVATLTALTLGARGAVLLEGGREVARARPPRVRAVDGTGAGDAFTAALVVGLLEGRERSQALARACAAGALAASRPGAQPSLPTAAELEEIMRT